MQPRPSQSFTVRARSLFHRWELHKLHFSPTEHVDPLPQFKGVAYLRSQDAGQNRGCCLSGNRRMHAEGSKQVVLHVPDCRLGCRDLFPVQTCKTRTAQIQEASKLHNLRATRHSLKTSERIFFWKQPVFGSSWLTLELKTQQGPYLQPLNPPEPQPAAKALSRLRLRGLRGCLDFAQLQGYEISPVNPHANVLDGVCF